jgi:hypothetical protein
VKIPFQPLKQKTKLLLLLIERHFHHDNARVLFNY